MPEEDEEGERSCRERLSGPPLKGTSIVLVRTCSRAAPPAPAVKGWNEAELLTEADGGEMGPRTNR